MDWFLYDGDLRQERVKVRGYLVREYFNIFLFFFNFRDIKNTRTDKTLIKHFKFNRRGIFFFSRKQLEPFQKPLPLNFALLMVNLWHLFFTALHPWKLLNSNKNYDKLPWIKLKHSAKDSVKETLFGGYFHERSRHQITP